MSAQALYDLPRGCWRISENNYPRIEYVFAVYHGLVKAVYQPEAWYKILNNGNDYDNAPKKTSLHDLKNLHRSYFVGKPADAAIIDQYLNKDISDCIVKTQNPIVYINV